MGKVPHGEYVLAAGKDVALIAEKYTTGNWIRATLQPIVHCLVLNTERSGGCQLHSATAI